jgi:hypothetical protein
MPETKDIKQVFSNLYSVHSSKLLIFRIFFMIIGTYNRDLMGNPWPLNLP